jgi:TetR/AcrR family transcriptional regulator, cholesterol catabolism regulator
LAKVTAVNNREIKEPTASRILTEGAQLFREQGYAVSTTRELSARLGINKASLYYHIESKEDLLRLICLESLRRVTEAVNEALESSDDPLEKVHAICHAHLTSVLSDLDLHATMLLELRALTGQRRIDVQRARDTYESLLVTAIADAQTAGLMRDDLTAKDLTVGLLSLLNWTISWYKPDGKMSPDDLAEMFWRLYTGGAEASS